MACASCWRVVIGLLGLLSIVAGATGCRSGAQVARSTAQFPPGRGFTAHDFLFDGEPHRLWVFVPKSYRPGQPSPSILFLHGLFESGEDGDSCLRAGLAPAIARDPDNWPFITIFPQSPGTWKDPDHERLALAALDYAQKTWTIDRDRVILAGLSYGGLATWEIGAEYRDRFAALVPVSGLRALELVPQLRTIPVWAFSFEIDVFVSPNASEDMCRAIVAQGGSARLSQFDGIGHDCWDRVVDEPGVVPWMLSQRRSAAAVADVR